METNQLEKQVRSFLRLSHETEWVEFKHNNADPEEIGEYISALANAAALVNQPTAYLIWGVDDASHRLIGTSFNPRTAKVGNQELESWLIHLLSPRVDFQFHQLEMDNQPIVVLVIPAAQHTPVRFKETEFIRVGSYKKKLKEYPEKERRLWAGFQQWNFEADVAMESVSADQVVNLLDYPAYFHLTKQPLPINRDGILERFLDEKFIVAQPTSDFHITNFGAILFARDLNRFSRLARKAVRIIFYRGKGRAEAIREMRDNQPGYAVVFHRAMQYINDHLPAHEELQGAYQREVRMYPDVALRELLANLLIHQDFSIRGAGPAVEVFDDRIEFINPGAPLIEPHRFIDKPPRSRNEGLAGFLRRINIGEERGTGIDKVILAVEAAQLPPPEFFAKDDNTIAILFAEKPFAEMTRTERLRACYQHACVLYEQRERMTNASLRKRMKIADSNYPMASKIIAETLKAGLIKVFDSGSESKRDKSYIPNWE
jgi:predicted HTH transcriptional regulator